METKVVSPISEDEAREYRSKLRCRAAALKAQRAQRKERRAERSAEIERHRQAELEAQVLINGINAEAESNNQSMTEARNGMIAYRQRFRDAKQARAVIATKLEAAYATRQAARDALKTLHAEIVGHDGDEVQA